MKSLPTLPTWRRATVLCLGLMGGGLSHAALDEDIAGMAANIASLADRPPTAGRMSTTLGKRHGATKPSAPVSMVRSTDATFDLAVQNAPAAQVFLQIGLGSHYNILVPPDLTGSISISLKNTTVPEALETLREMFGYDYRITGNRVFIYANTVQTRLFHINYLPGRREGASELSVASTSSSAAAAPGASSGTGASATAQPAAATAVSRVTSSVKTTSDTDFWRDVRESLGALVGAKEGRSVTINAGAGVIVVRATPAELRQVTDYLRAIQVTIERQVMLEAKIVEVQLSKSSETGINWSLFRNLGDPSRKATLINAGPGNALSNTGLLCNVNTVISQGNSLVTESLGKGFYGLALQSATFSALLSFLQSQGDVQVLSSPRITALNNQKSVLKVGSDEEFVGSVTNNVTVVNNTVVNSPSVTTKTYFSGISLDVTPHIDENGTVMLHVHPAISTATKKDLLLQLGSSGTYNVPAVSVSINETDSMVRVQDGQIVAIGGLMQQTGSRSSSGIPGLSEAPVFGGLFRQKASSSTKRELVILIKPTVIRADGADGAGEQPVLPDTPLLQPDSPAR